MKIYLDRIKLFLLLLTPLLFSCIGDRCYSCKQEKSSNGQFKIDFSGSYAITKSASVFPAGVETSFFAYYSGEDPSHKKEHPGTPITAVSDNSGNFQIANNLALYLAPGYYDFYAISTNSLSLIGLAFKMGQSDTLKNGIDYLWAQKRDITICNNSNIQFNFNHVAASIIIEVTTNTDSQANSQQLKLNRVLIDVPETYQTLKLASGEIIPAKSLSALKAKMHIDSNKATYIILPLAKGVEIPVELDITSIPSSNQETYFCKLPSPANGFQGGMQYKYRITVSLGKISFGNATVEHWNEKEISNIFLSEKE